MYVVCMQTAATYFSGNLFLALSLALPLMHRARASTEAVLIRAGVCKPHLIPKICFRLEWISKWESRKSAF